MENETTGVLRMEWLNENSRGLGFIFVLLSGFVGWLVRLELRLQSKVSKDDFTDALKAIYDILRPMGENIANIKGKLENRHEQSQ